MVEKTSEQRQTFIINNALYLSNEIKTSKQGIAMTRTHKSNFLLEFWRSFKS